MQASTRELWEGENDLTLRLWAVTKDGAVACVLVDSVELDRREGVLRCVTAEATEPRILAESLASRNDRSARCDLQTTIDGDRFSLRAATFCFACSQEYDDELGDFPPRSDGDFLNSLVEEGVWVPTRPRTV